MSAVERVTVTMPGSYLIFFVASEDGIEIVRVLHGARDLVRLFTA